MITIHSHLSLLSNSFALRTDNQGPGQAQALPTTEGPERALSSLQGKALNALAREIPGVDASAIQAMDPDNYTPEKVADRISQFVSLGLENARAQGKSEEELQVLYESALKGVEQGFREAKEILSNLNLLGGPIAEQVEATERATFDALSGLSPIKEEAPIAEAGAVAVAVSERFQRADNFELTLQTREGDEVRISFSRELEAGSRFTAVADGEGRRAASLDVSRSESSGYRFSVEGDLSVEEIDAIQELVRDVGQVANDFYKGDVQKAFDQVSDVAFDDSQLASMNLHMSRSEQYTATHRYRETQELENPERVESGRRLGHLMREMQDLADRSALGFLDRVRDAAGQIMQGLAQEDSRFKDAASDRQALYQGNLERLLSGFGETD